MQCWENTLKSNQNQALTQNYYCLFMYHLVYYSDNKKHNRPLLWPYLASFPRHDKTFVENRQIFGTLPLFGAPFGGDWNFTFGSLAGKVE